MQRPNTIRAPRLDRLSSTSSSVITDEDEEVPRISIYEPSRPRATLQFGEPISEGRRQSPSSGMTNLWSFFGLASSPPQPHRLEGLSTSGDLDILHGKTQSPGLELIPVHNSSHHAYDECSTSSSEVDANDEALLLEAQEAPRDDEHLVVVSRPGFRKRLALIRFSPKTLSSTNRVPQVSKEIDVQEYMANREMTRTQEKWNALTIVPNPVFCLYFLLSGLWVDSALVEQMRHAGGGSEMGETSGFGGLANDVLGDMHGCLNPTPFGSGLGWLHHNMPALPPLPAVAVALGITLHAPFSFLYHWHYSHSLPAGAPRTNHWSRRMDQSMIHVASALMAYGTSGSWDFFLANALYNADCVYRQFKAKVRPRRNKIRLAISFLAYTMPILRRGDLYLFANLWAILLVSFWLFAKYPIGGWSHSAFHLVIALAPPLLMTAACELPMAQEQMRLAAQCVVRLEHQHSGLPSLLSS